MYCILLKLSLKLRVSQSFEEIQTYFSSQSYLTAGRGYLARHTIELWRNPFDFCETIELWSPITFMYIYIQCYNGPRVGMVNVLSL